MCSLSKLFSSSPVLIDGGLVRLYAFIVFAKPDSWPWCSLSSGNDAYRCVQSRFGYISLVIGSSDQEPWISARDTPLVFTIWGTAYRNRIVSGSLYALISLILCHLELGIRVHSAPTQEQVTPKTTPYD